jgi:radical SAM superfamily enzyme YgiQ (UPF0313 family)
MKVGLAFLPAWVPYNPPLGISCISAVIEREGHEVTFFDYNAHIYDEVKNDCGDFWLMDNAHLWDNPNEFKNIVFPKISKYLNQLAKKVAFSDLDAIGFSMYSTNSQPTAVVIKLIKSLRPDIKIFIGGAQVDEDMEHDLFQQGIIDAAVIGEGENSTIDLLNYWKGDYEGEVIPGVLLRTKSGEVSKGPKRPLLNMKELPIPDFSKFDLKRYTSDCFPIEFSRGCVAKCTFCEETNYWVSFRVKTPKQIVEEFKYHKEKYGVRVFRVVDSLMNGNHRMLEDLCDLIIHEGLDVEWQGFCRISPKLTPSLLAKMKKAGCLFVNFGIESGSQNVLNLMKKRYKLHEIYKVVKDTHAAGIEVHTQILLGFPGETWFNFYETLKMIFQLRPFFKRIYPGIPLVITKKSFIYDNLETYNVHYSENREWSHRWRTKNYLNNYFVRKVRHWVLVNFLKASRMDHGYPLEVK